MILDCYDFYLWTIGELRLPAHLEPKLQDYNLLTGDL